MMRLEFLICIWFAPRLKQYALSEIVKNESDVLGSTAQFTGYEPSVDQGSHWVGSVV